MRLHASPDEIPSRSTDIGQLQMSDQNVTELHMLHEKKQVFMKGLGVLMYIFILTSG